MFSNIRNISVAVLASTLKFKHSKNKKPIKKLLVLKWTKFHVSCKLGNFEYYCLMLVSYKQNVYEFSKVGIFLAQPVDERILFVVIQNSIISFSIATISQISFI